MQEVTDSFFDHFDELEDPRIDRSKRYMMSEIIFLTLCGIISGCKGWIDLEDYGTSHLEFLRKYLPYKNGTPSDDTLRRFFRAIDSKQLSACFRSWVKSIVDQDSLEDEKEDEEKVIAIDGKTSKGSVDGAKAALHIVSAYATNLQLVLCQEKVSEKSNEITAIPKVLDVLDLRGATVTIDAMGTQKTIAAKIVEGGGDYILALKKNHANLFEEVDTFFTLEQKDNYKDVEVDIFTTLEKGHGRIEKRTCIVANIDNYISSKKDWANIKSIVCIESEREIKGKKTKEKRFYITSLKMDAKKILAKIRSHWGIENSVHWVLDMNFGDDQSKIRKGNAPANMAVIKHFALNFLNNAKPLFNRVSIRRLMRMAGWRDDVLDTILSVNF